MSLLKHLCFRPQMLNYVAAGSYDPDSDYPLTEADLRANRLLLYRTMTGCDPARLQLGAAYAMHEMVRPAYTRRLCQVRCSTYWLC